HFVGHGALRLAAVGSENRALSTDDLKAMERRLDEAMDAGAYGYSTGLVYPPSAYATTEELVLLARSMARRGGLYFSHVRGARAARRPHDAAAHRRGVPGGRRALAHPVRGLPRLRRDLDRDVPPARAGGPDARGARAADGQDSGRGDDGSAPGGARDGRDGRVLSGPHERRQGAAPSGHHDRLGLDRALRGDGTEARQAAPAHVRDLSAGARRVRARAEALRARDGGPQDDRHAGRAAR